MKKNCYFSGTLWLELSVGVLVVEIAIDLVSIPEFPSSNPGSKGTQIMIVNPVKNPANPEFLYQLPF